MHLVLGPGALTHQRRPASSGAGDSAPCAHRNPHCRQHVRPTATPRQRSAASKRSDFTRAWLIARSLLAPLATCTTRSATWRSAGSARSRTPGRSPPTRPGSSGARLPANSSNAATDDLDRAAGRRLDAGHRSAIADLAEVAMHVQTDAYASAILPSSMDRYGGASQAGTRQLRIRARAAQPAQDRRGGQLAVNELAAQNAIAGLPHLRLPRAPAPVSRRYDRTRTEAHHSFMPVACSCIRCPPWD